VAVEGAEFGNPRRRWRADFDFNSANYRFSVTDPYIRDRYPKDGDYSFAEAIVCVSLAQYDDGYAYKLVAGVLTPERAGEKPCPASIPLVTRTIRLKSCSVSSGSTR